MRSRVRAQNHSLPELKHPHLGCQGGADQLAVVDDLMRVSGPHDADHLTERLAGLSAELVEWLIDDTQPWPPIWVNAQNKNRTRKATRRAAG